MADPVSDQRGADDGGPEPLEPGGLDHVKVHGTEGGHRGDVAPQETRHVHYRAIPACPRCA